MHIYAKEDGIGNSLILNGFCVGFAIFRYYWHREKNAININGNRQDQRLLGQ